jgi:hypothetical protein
MKMCGIIIFPGVQSLGMIAYHRGYIVVYKSNKEIQSASNCLKLLPGTKHTAFRHKYMSPLTITSLILCLLD